MWYYKNSPMDITDIPLDAVGFVYKITNIGDNPEKDWIYIGKKQLNFKRKKALTKKEKLLPENKRKRFKTVISDSGWLDYYGSSALLKASLDLYGKESFRRDILHFCNGKKKTSFLEMEEQVLNDVLRINSYNAHILNFYKRDI